MNYNLGRVLPIFKGEYDNDEIYINLDVVYYNGSSYVAKEETQGNLPTDTEYWQPIAMAGVLDPEQIADIEQQVIDYVQGQGYVIDPNYTHTDNNYTNADKTKLDGIDMSTKQDTLVSGTNIKTINNENILGSGNINIEGVSDYNDLNNKPSINGATLTGNVNLATPSDLATKQNTLVSGTNIKTINNQSILGSGNINIEGGSGTSDYTQLSNKPKINNVELSGNKASSALGLQEMLISGTNIKTINNEDILGSGNISISGGSSDAVLYTLQTLTTEQQEQARENINALSATTSGTTPDVSFNSYNVVVLNDESEMPATPSSNTLYFIKEAVS